MSALNVFLFLCSLSPLLYQRMAMPSTSTHANHFRLSPPFLARKNPTIPDREAERKQQTPGRSDPASYRCAQSPDADPPSVVPADSCHCEVRCKSRPSLISEQSSARPSLHFSSVNYHRVPCSSSRVTS